MSFRSLRRGGRYLRVADPSWQEPLDGSYSSSRGGRWNAPGSFGVLYLNQTIAVARANVRRLFAGLPYGPEDLDPHEAPLLVETDVPADGFVDIVTDDGCLAAGLPITYPLEDGQPIPHSRCQPIGQRAWDSDWPGIACRSAAPGCDREDEELAWFQRQTRLAAAAIRPFDDWFWPPAAAR